MDISKVAHYLWPTVYSQWWWWCW